MRRGTRPSRPSFGFLVVCACGVAELVVSTVRILTDSNTTLLARYTTDDAFYYFDIARRFPHVSASPGITTTGFHPFYWLTLVPIFQVTHGFAAVRTALLMLLIVHIVAGLLLYRLLRRSWSETTCALVAGAWMASAGLRAVVLLGVETAWVELALIGLLLACTNKRPTRTMAPRVGALLAFCYLARNDSVFVAGAIVLAWLWWRRPDRRSVLTLAATALAISLPWLAFLAVHNSLVGTDSARALRYTRGSPDLFEVYRQMADLMASRTAALILDRYVPHPGGGTAILLVSFAVVVGGAIAMTRRHRWSPCEIAMVVSLPLLFVAYGVQLGGIREWYLVYLDVAIFVVLLPPVFEVLGRIVTNAVKNRRGRYAIASAGLVLGVAASLVGPFAEHPEEGMKYTAARIAAPAIGKGRVGALNSGVFAFVLDHAVVENLDGVVNPLVQPDVRHKTMCAYFEQQHLTWFIDDAKSAQLLTRLGGPSGTTRVLVAARGATLPAEVLVRVDTTTCAAGENAAGN